MGTDFGLREQVPIDGRLFWALVVFAMAGARELFGVEERRGAAKQLQDERVWMSEAVSVVFPALKQNILSSANAATMEAVGVTLGVLDLSGLSPYVSIVSTTFRMAAPSAETSSILKDSSERNASDSTPGLTYATSPAPDGRYDYRLDHPECRQNV